MIPIITYADITIKLSGDSGSHDPHYLPPRLSCTSEHAALIKRDRGTLLAVLFI